MVVKIYYLCLVKILTSESQSIEPQKRREMILQEFCTEVQVYGAHITAFNTISASEVKPLVSLLWASFVALEITELPSVTLKPCCPCNKGLEISLSQPVIPPPSFSLTRLAFIFISIANFLKIELFHIILYVYYCYYTALLYILIIFRDMKTVGDQPHEQLRE